MGFDIGIEDSFIVSTVVAVAERKKGEGEGRGRGGRGERQLDNLLLKPPLPSSPIKQRSLSLGRAVDSVIVSQQPVVAGEEDESTTTADAAAAGPSAAKVARSKSSVEKKFQHEVAGFWRRKEFNRLFKSGGGSGSQSRDRSQVNSLGHILSRHSSLKARALLCLALTCLALRERVSTLCENTCTTDVRLSRLN